MKRPLIFVCLLLHTTATLVAGEEAIELTGRRQPGRLVHEKAMWFFRADSGKPISLKELSHIRFEPIASMQPRYPLTKTLLLPGGQRQTGALLKLDERLLEFANAPGKSHVLRRDQVVGITHADDWLPVVSEDFETPLKTWKVQGAAELDANLRFFGKHSLKLNKIDQVLGREWPPLREGRISLAFTRPIRGPAQRWTIEVLASDTPTVVIDDAGVRCTGLRDNFGTLELGPSWHSLVIEWQADVLRIYVNDRCLGQTSLPKRADVSGIRFSTKLVGGALNIDELTVARRLRTMPVPKSDPVQDSVWLEHGEQLFGRVVSADQRSVVFDAKFGTRTFPWSQIRGIGFANGKRASPENEVEIEIRPGPGCSADRLHVKLLRWDDMKLIVQHATLGEIAIERERLEMVRFAAK